jgi:TDG/mug DNA glycosylase family protein
MLSFGFPPVASPSARVLALGTLPSQKSLERAQYYANPQNQFWKIAAVHVPALPADYAGRVSCLAQRGVALWDVLAAATRSGSLDADIEEDAIPNHFRALFHLCPGIQLIGFNGQRAANLYEVHVLPRLPETQRAIARCTLPSTSAAHASLSLTQKAERWSVVWGS